jgi:hypothetical protein
VFLAEISALFAGAQLQVRKAFGMLAGDAVAVGLISFLVDFVEVLVLVKGGILVLAFVLFSRLTVFFPLRPAIGRKLVLKPKDTISGSDCAHFVEGFLEGLDPGELNLSGARVILALRCSVCGLDGEAVESGSKGLPDDGVKLQVGLVFFEDFGDDGFEGGSQGGVLFFRGGLEAVKLLHEVRVQELGDSGLLLIAASAGSLSLARGLNCYG